MDIDIKELVKVATENLDLSKFKGDVVGVKIVENEFGNIEPGGIGIQINNGKPTPVAKTDEEIKAAIEDLLKEKDDSGELLFRNKKQWWAVYRVLEEFLNYPSKRTMFVTKINNLEIDYAGNDNKITYDSLVAAPKDVPFMTMSPISWDTVKDKSENYLQQYVVADYLMQKLGIKA